MSEGLCLSGCGIPKARTLPGSRGATQTGVTFCPSPPNPSSPFLPPPPTRNLQLVRGLLPAHGRLRPGGGSEPGPGGGPAHPPRAAAAYLRAGLEFGIQPGDGPRGPVGGSLQRPLEPHLAAAAAAFGPGGRSADCGRVEGSHSAGAAAGRSWGSCWIYPPPASRPGFGRLKARVSASCLPRGSVGGGARGVGRPPEVTPRRLPVRPVGAGAAGKRRAGLAAGFGDGPGQVMGPVPQPGYRAARGGPGRPWGGGGGLTRCRSPQAFRPPRLEQCDGVGNDG